MVEKRSFESLGHADHGWLNARHHFSFANYYDPDRMGWGSLRVWNDDEIAANSGFPPHPHRDMEIITYVRSGAITHQDSLGNSGRTGAGDVQVMSAGTGVRHSEYNLEPETTRIFQIWIEPKRLGGSPSWGAKPFPKGDRSGRFVTLASGFEDEIAAGALPIRADAQGGREPGLCAGRGPAWLSGACDWPDRAGRRRAERARWRCDHRGRNVHDHGP
jgi:quercetin 2,3-dioxygenase